jgi:hypothetical protein
VGGPNVPMMHRIPSPPPMPRFSALAMDPGGLPDWDEETTIDATPFGDADGEKVVMTRSAVCVKERGATKRLADVMEEAQLDLGLAVACIEDCVSGMPHDPSTLAAADSLRCRVAELGDLRDALEAVCGVAAEPAAASFFSNDGAAGGYVRGVYLFASAAAAALDAIARELRAGSPDWTRGRERIDQATSFYFDGLASEVRLEMTQLGVHEDARAKIEELFFAAAMFAHGLEKRFG